MFFINPQLLLQKSHEIHPISRSKHDQPHLGVALDVGGQIGACEVSGAHRVFDLIPALWRPSKAIEVGLARVLGGDKPA